MTETPSSGDRREFLTKAAKVAVIIPPAMTVLLSTTMASPAIACSARCGSENGNNGLGNGLDPQPPGDPKPNDT